MRLRKGDTEHPDNVAIGSAAINVGLNDRLALLNKRADLVAGHVHSVEVHEAVVSLNVLDAKLHFAPREGLVVLQVGKAELDDTALQTIRCNLSTLRLGDDCLAAVLCGKDGRSYKLVPFLLQERVNTLEYTSGHEEI